jgi:hypothetical protein
MKRLCAVGAIAALSMIGVGVAASPVAAAPSVNDAYADRDSLVLASPVTVDTTEATVEPLDLEATQACPSPPGPPPETANTVWYDWDAGAGPPSQVAVTFSESSFPAGVAVVIGDPGSFTGVACGLAAIFTPEASTIYHVMVFDPFGTGGGTTMLTVGEVPPAPTLSLTVDSKGHFEPRTGAATLSGTYRCTDAFAGELFGQVRQQVGRFAVVGFFAASGADCDGEDHAWTATVLPENGKFAGGMALTVAVGFACGVIACTEAVVEQTVVLTGGRP